MMSMSEPALQVRASQMIQWAVGRESVAEACVTARGDHPRAVAAAESWGPLFCEARRAAVAAVNAREAALMTIEERHRAMARELRVGAARLEEMNMQNRANLTISTD